MQIRNFKILKNLIGPVLITGHTGFKGTWMTLLLERIGFEVIGYSLKPEEDSLFNFTQRAGKINEVYDDIRDIEKLENFILKNKPSLIYNFAAQPLVIDSYSSAHETFEINSMGTVNILNISQKYDSTKFVGAVTTDKVYENKGTIIKFKETDPLAGSDPYSESKVAAEAAIRAWQKISMLENGPQIVSLRAGNVIGGGDLSKNRLAADIVRADQSGTDLIVRNRLNSRPWQHVLDVVYGYLLAAEYSLMDSAIKAVNFAPREKSLTVEEFVNIAKNKMPNLNVHYLDNHERKFLEATNLQLDSSYAVKNLEWEPLYSQSESILATFEWWNNYTKYKSSAIESCNHDLNYFFSNIKLPKYLMTKL
jgi:CDP-glucose 4,6-dehydratase